MSALPFNTLVGLLVCLLLIIILLLICLFCRKRALKCLSASCACCCGAFIHLFSCCMVQFTSAIIWMAESIRQKCAGRAAGDNQSQNEPGSEVIPKENLFLNCFTRFFLHWDLTIFICFFQFILLFLSFFVSPVNFFVAIALLFFLGGLFFWRILSFRNPKKTKEWARVDVLQRPTWLIWGRCPQPLACLTPKVVKLLQWKLSLPTLDRKNLQWYI